MPEENRELLIALGKSSLATYTTARENNMLIEVQVPHWRDALILSRGAAIISYSALMTAASIVYLTGSKSASVLAPKYFFSICVVAACLSLVCFLVSALLSLTTIVRGFGARRLPEGDVKNVDDLWVRLGKIAQYHRWQRDLQKAALTITIVATTILSFTLVVSIAGNLGGLLAKAS